MPRTNWSCPSKREGIKGILMELEIGLDPIRDACCHSERLGNGLALPSGRPHNRVSIKFLACRDHPGALGALALGGHWCLCCIQMKPRRELVR